MLIVRFVTFTCIELLSQYANEEEEEDGVRHRSGAKNTIAVAMLPRLNGCQFRYRRYALQCSGIDPSYA